MICPPLSFATLSTVYPSERPWLFIAQQILAGNFDAADKTTLKALIIGTRNIHHPLARRATAALQRLDKKAAYEFSNAPSETEDLSDVPIPVP